METYFHAVMILIITTITLGFLALIEKSFLIAGACIFLCGFLIGLLMGMKLMEK